MGLHGHGGEVNGAQVGLIETTGVIEMKMVVRVVDSGEGIEGEDLVEMKGDAAEEGEDHSVVDGHLEMKTMKNTAPRTNQLCMLSLHLLEELLVSKSVGNAYWVNFCSIKC